MINKLRAVKSMGLLAQTSKPPKTFYQTTTSKNYRFAAAYLHSADSIHVQSRRGGDQLKTRLTTRTKFDIFALYVFFDIQVS